jgi:tetratricopeptide (TPR) repeat protein
LLQLAFIYAKYLRRADQAIDYVNRAIALDPRNIDAYERLCEIALEAGDEKKALQSLDRAAEIRSDDPAFWARLGKLYASIVFKPDRPPNPDEIARVNEIFKKAADHAGDDPAVLKDVGDYYASTRQVKEAIPLYLRLLELEPDDTNAREKLATGFVLTNQRDKAVETLEGIIKEHPEKYQPYDLLAGLLDDAARVLEREKKSDQAKATFAKAAANYEQSLTINPGRASPYLHLAELLLGPLKDNERAVKILSEARQHFPQTPEIVYYLGIAQREAKHFQEAVATFEEALHEAEQMIKLALQADQNNGAYIDTLGWLEFRQGKFDEALSDLLRAAQKLTRDDPVVLEHIGDTYAKLNKSAQALDAWQKAFNLDPQNKKLADKIDNAKTKMSKGQPPSANQIH